MKADKKVRETVFVVFTKNADQYNKGEVAKFTPEQAENLVKREVAKIYTPKEKTK